MTAADVTADDAARDGGGVGAPTVLRAIAAVGVVVGLVLGVTAWVFLSDLDRNLDQSLAIGVSASGSVLETIDVAERLIESLDQGLGTVGATLATVEATLDDTAGLAAATSSLSATLPESFDDIDAALATVETLSGAIDAALGGLSRIPFGPDYEPDVPLPDAVANLRAAFAPIGDDLTSISSELQAFSDNSDDVGEQIAAVRADLRETRTALTASSRLLVDYRVTAEDAGELAASSRDDTSRGFALARIGVILLAAFVIVAQYIPWWLARMADRLPIVVTAGERDPRLMTESETEGGNTSDRVAAKTQRRGPT